MVRIATSSIVLRFTQLVLASSVLLGVAPGCTAGDEGTDEAGSAVDGTPDGAREQDAADAARRQAEARARELRALRPAILAGYRAVPIAKVEKQKRDSYRCLPGGADASVDIFYSREAEGQAGDDLFRALTAYQYFSEVFVVRSPEPPSPDYAEGTGKRSTLSFYLRKRVEFPTDNRWLLPKNGLSPFCLEHPNEPPPVILTCTGVEENKGPDPKQCGL